ncbi:MAG: peptide deformylase [Candidatus Wildermuthbacteria bacterium RIFCSPHIGHO2_12_FULL_45_9]|uniref:Peptide deformylase n=1 Tax=Candidatus Wildermuthbacteria bacterium RIFCSPHIGHO2_02_FULL_45_25 TaxID=1802450 RepID=A0A1G2R224_9BACT|nr:MAG: peptide deformylase [Candidatus Wildermuthbacteria bacterium RIFCSPHIGHO2_01_FULL_45_20]OHA66439.1 MAG: peptide deformylase [Candidatus Wildermuthbacteria bacterium RIFCSPHIGHO2_02_FULL_45_25]OHA71744.1 MAG: peptide deformylase [Candidatus Wildermuthbacteria bacterium RIFCSPHIGHO2_12_FULL_45_9]
MAKHTIIKYPDPVLFHESVRVSSRLEGLSELVSDMVAVMYEYQGIGLAGPQVGVAKRIIIVESAEHPEQGKRKPLAFLNPKIIRKSGGEEAHEEGCLSLPGIFVPVKRARKVEVLCETPEGEEVRIEAEGLGARIFQHEVDHLNGMLIIHRISRFRRMKVRKELRKLDEDFFAK